MNPSTRKRVVVRNRQGGYVCGFLESDPAAAGPLALLTPEGQALELEAGQVQAVAFVADWERAAAAQNVGNTGHLGPRLPGLWVRVQCRGKHWEGILASSMLELGQGAWLSPLYPDSPWQRLFIPRLAIEQITAVEVVRAPRRRGARRPSSGQIGLFDSGGEEGRI